MKKTKKLKIESRAALQLSRATVRALSSTELTEVAAGGTTKPWTEMHTECTCPLD